MNNKFLVRDRFLIAIVFLYIAYTIFPLFEDMTGTPIYGLPLMVTMTILLMYPKAFMRLPTQWFIVYLVVLILYIILDKPLFVNGVSQSLSPIYRILIESSWILPNVAIMNVLLSKNDLRLFKIIGYGSLGLLIISFLYLLPMVTTYSNYLREDFETWGDDKPIGLPDYTLMHAYTLMILPLCLWVKRTEGKIKYLSLSVVLLFAYMVTQTAVTTSLVVMTIAVLFTCIFDIRKLLRSVMIICLFLIVSYVLNQYGFFLNVVGGLMPYFEGTAVSSKLEDLHTSMVLEQVTGSSLTGRIDYHQISKDAFIANPILGTDRAGGHSKILDMLGTMGLLAFIPYIMVLYSSLKGFVIRIKDKEYKSYLYFSFILSGIYLYTKGLFGSSGYLFTLVIVPSIIIAIYNDVSFRKNRKI